MHNTIFFHPHSKSGGNCILMRQNAIKLTLLLLILLVCQIHTIIPSRPIVVSPNTESSPSNFIFNFILSKQLQSTGYLMVTFAPFSTAAIPKSCLIINSPNASLSISQCVNLQIANSVLFSSNDYITINQTWINSINPNIQIQKTIVMRFNQNLNPNQQYSIQIITDNVLPAIGSITTNFQLYTISGTGFMIEENWNFGQVYFQQKQNNILTVNSINDLKSNFPGTLTSNLQFQITIKVNCPTPYSRLKFIISNDFEFSPSSRLNIQGILSSAPQVIETEIVSPNIILTTFGEAFVQNRKFKISITDIKNPLKISSGFLSVYYLPYNSMSPLQVKELSIPIATKAYAPVVQVLTGEGLAKNSPMQFYEQKQQYLTVTIILPRECDSDFVIQILTDTLTIHEGTVYAKTPTVLAQKLTYDHYTEKGFRISGFPNIPEGSKITITFKVWIPNIPSFNVFVSIDKQSQIDDPIMKGSAATVDTTVPNDFISSFTGSQNEPNKLSSMTSTSSLLKFTVTPTFTTQADSSLYIYTSKYLIKATDFNATISCLVNGVSKTCSVDTNSSCTKISINSGSSNNYFPINTATNIEIRNLQFLYVSSNTQYIHQFYFQITSLSTTNPIIKKTIFTPQVIPERNLMTGLTNHFSNDLYNYVGNNYVNIFRVVSTLPAEWNFVIQSTERRMITIFAKQKWTNLFTNLKSGDQYPFLSSISGVQSTLIEGTAINNTIDCPLNWDQVHLILPGTENTTKFSIALPINYIVGPEYHFQIMTGIYNTETRAITYKFIQPKPELNSPTYKNFTSSISISSKPKQTNTKIQLSGYAGAYKNNISITVSPASGTFSGTSYSTALIITSTWNWFDSSSDYNSLSTASTNPQFSLIEQKPLSLKLGNQWYLTYIPFKTTSTYPSLFSIILDSIKLPYTHDLPYYSILLIDETGTVDSYNEFINQDQGVFYESNLKKITFSCSDNSLGVTNTDCSIGFMPYQQIQVQNTIYVTLKGLKVSTDKCLLQKNSDLSSFISLTCASNRDKNQLIVSLLNTERLPGLTEYTLKIYGMQIQTSTIIHYTDMSIRDSSGGYIIQKGSRILLTSVSTQFPIYIEQLTYLKNNPIVVSGFKVIFSLPRQLNKDEVFALVMGNDLSNLNSVPCKLNVKLFYQNNNTQINNVRWFLYTKNYQIIFEGLHDVLASDKYRLEIYGMKTPSTITQDIISLIFLRTYDNTYTVQNVPESTSTYPSLVEKVNSQITIQTYFNTEGLQQPMKFTITNQFAQVNSDTIWYLTLPRYYSQQIWQKSYLAYCRIDTTKLSCQKDPNIPYTIKISNSPKIIDIGTTYTIEVNGVKCPRKTYAEGNSLYATENIFFGVAESDSSQYYIEYSELYMVQSVINPQDAGYGAVIVTSISSSNNQTHQTTFLSINLKCTVVINPLEMIYVKFPDGFNNFNDIQMEGDLVYAGVSKSFTAEVINTRMGFAVPAGVTILPNTEFTLQISSLPTPKIAVEIDMNQLQVIVTPASMLSTNAATLQLHNLVSTKTFNSSQLHLVINNYTTIELTAGTYSDPIIIESSDKNPFLSNIKVQFISNVLTFEPQPTYLLLGDYNGEFRIGTQQTLIPTVYTFEIIKSQTSISAFYTALSRYSVRVTTAQIPITIPSSVDVPKGGCSIPFKISLLNAPFSDIKMKFEYDSFEYTLDEFWINYEISNNELEFNKSITDRWVSFCSSPTFDVPTLPVSIYLGGTNVQSYTLSTKTINVKILPNTTTNIIPTLSLTVANTQKTYARFNITTNINGYVFYELKLSSLSDPLPLVELKKLIKQKTLILQSQNDYLNNQIYTTDRDHRINFQPVPSGLSLLQFQGLLPQRDYTLCVFFQNQHRVSTNRICQSFTMQNWGVIKKFQIKFTTNIFQSQLNNLLCYFSKASNSQITQVVDIEGKSCSLNTSASNYYFSYKGSLLTNQLSSTIIYHITDKNLTTDPSSSAFSSLYNSQGITASSLSMALSNFSINYIQSSYAMGTYNPMDMINIQSSNFAPVLTFTPASYVSGSYSLYLRNLRLSKAGSVYLILTSYKRIIKDQISGHVDVQIRPLITPTQEQILNCKDGYDEDPLSCQRVVLKEYQSLDVKFSDIKQNRMYAVFYMITNEYPLRPIVYGNVKTTQLLTVVLDETGLRVFFLIMFLLIGLLL